MMVLAIVVSFWSGYLLGVLWHTLLRPQQRRSRFREYLDHIEQEMVEDGYIKRSV